MCSPLKIALAGRKYSGKSTIAHELERLTGGAYGSASKGMIDLALVGINAMMATDGASISYQDLIDDKEWYRPFLQWVGGDFCEIAFGDRSHLIRRAFHDLDSRKRQDAYVFDSIRELYQVDMVRNRGYAIVRITNPDLPNDDEHESEAEVDDMNVDLDIINDWSMSPETVAVQILGALGWYPD